MQSNVNVGLCRVSNNFKGDITAAENNTILVLVLKSYRS
jgi:hypothetical protein